MYFWSVSLVDQLSGQFLIFLVDQFFFWSTNFFFWSTKNMRKWFLVDQKENWSTKNMRNWFLVNQKKNWSTKKIRNWPDNWSTKETDQKYMDAANMKKITRLLILFINIDLFFYIWLFFKRSRNWRILSSGRMGSRTKGKIRFRWWKAWDTLQGSNRFDGGLCSYCGHKWV